MLDRLWPHINSGLFQSCHHVNDLFWQVLGQVLAHSLIGLFVLYLSVCLLQI